MGSMSQFLAAEGSLGVFILVSVVMGGGAAWLSGRAIAMAWRPWWHLVALMLILAFAVRFIHFAVFGSTLLSLYYYLVDTAVCLIAGLTGFRHTRARQMVARYNWLYEPVGPFAWRRRGNSNTPAGLEQG
jgi:Domain of unknown function (DUF6867)